MCRGGLKGLCFGSALLLFTIICCLTHARAHLDSFTYSLNCYCYYYYLSRCLRRESKAASICEPANQVFWEWEDLPGEVSLEPDSGDVSSTEDLRKLVSNYAMLRILIPPPTKDAMNGGGVVPTEESTSNGASSASSPGSSPTDWMRVDVHGESPIAASVVPLKTPYHGTIPLRDTRAQRKVWGGNMYDKKLV